MGQCIRLILVLAVPMAAAAVEVPPEPVSLLKAQYVLHADAPTSETLLAASDAPIIPLQATAAQRRLTATIFGYLPYWESADNLRYDLLTHIACFSVGVNSNGTLGNDHGWPWTSVINTAHENGVKVILVATQFDSSAILTLITTPAYKAAFFQNIKAKMLEGSADGLNIDFEGGGAWRSYINGFMAELTAYLHAELPGCEVTFAGPAVNWSNAWDLDGLAASCDGIFIMGYAFSGSWSTNAGPTAPLTGGSINLTDTVLDEYGSVTQNYPEKLILGIPYYGAHFTVVSDQARAATTGYVESPRYRIAQPEAELYGRFWDATSQTPWYRYHDGAQWHQVWYDDAESLGLKYELAKSVNLQGVGMWALGYDGTRTELWDELERQFVEVLEPTPDFDGDGDVDQADFGHIQACFTDSGPPGPECENANLDGDLRVDQDDLAILLGCFGGSNVPIDPTCVE